MPKKTIIIASRQMTKMHIEMVCAAWHITMFHRRHWHISQTISQFIKNSNMRRKNRSVMCMRNKVREKMWPSLCRFRIRFASKTCHCHQVTEPFLVMLDSQQVIIIPFTSTAATFLKHNSLSSGAAATVILMLLLLLVCSA